MKELKDTKEFIATDHEELKLLAKVNSATDDELKKMLYQKYKKVVIRNRGISVAKGKTDFDADYFAGYVHDVRLQGIMVNEVVYLYNFSEGRYVPCNDTFLQKCLKIILEESGKTVWTLGRQRTYLTSYKLKLEQYSYIKPNPNRLVVGNGVLHLDELESNSKVELYDFEYDDISLNRIPVEFDPEAKCPKFLKTLHLIFDKDEDLIKNFQEMLGYLIYYGGDWKLQKFFVFMGSGSNGKSLICSVIQSLLGPENCSSSYLDSITERFGMEEMYSKMVNISPEFEQTKPLNTTHIKALCGDDLMSYEFKHKPAFSSYNYTKLIVCTNHEIKTNDDSYGFFRRLVIFPFNRTFHELKEGEQPKKGVYYAESGLREELLNELPGILNFALAGLSRLMKNKWTLTKSIEIENLQNQYYLEANEMENFFHSKVVYNESGRVQTSQIYMIYARWREQEKLKGSAPSKQKFHNRFKEILKNNGIPIDVREIHGNQHYFGISLKTRVDRVD